MKQSDCVIFRDSIAYVGNWITKQAGVKEESLTDWLLYELSYRIPRVLYKPFTRHEEGRTTGADWEWWFLIKGDNAYRFRVQAKRSKPNIDNYSSIARTNRYGLQIDKLITNAKKARAVPIYIFFTDSPNPDNTACRRGVECNGAFSVGANSIYNHFIAPGKNKVDEQSILKLSIPLECFACCPISARSGRMESFLHTYFQTELSAMSTDGGVDQPWLHRKLPAYVKSILDHPEGIPDWWGREYEIDLIDFNRLTIFDLREEQ